MTKKSPLRISEDLKSFYIDTAKKLKGSDRRQFMAQLVQQWGFGGATFAEKELRWNRRTIRKGMQELIHGISIADSFRLRGRQSVEHRLPNLVSDISSIVEPHSQTDPSFKSRRLYCRISSAKVRSLLIEKKGYSDEELPCEETIRCRLNQMGYKLRRVIKGKPKKAVRERSDDGVIARVGERTGLINS